MYISAGSTVAVSIGQIINPTDYYVVGVLPLANGFGDVWQVTYSIYGNNEVYALIHSYHGGGLTARVRCNVLFMKDL